MCVFMCNWIKKRRKPRTNNVTLKLFACSSFLVVYLQLESKTMTSTKKKWKENPGCSAPEKRMGIFLKSNGIQEQMGYFLSLCLFGTRRVSILVFGSILKNWNKKFTLFELRLDKQSEFFIPIFGGTKFSGIKKVNSLYLFFFQTSTFGCKLENVWITYQFFSKNKTSRLPTSNKRNMQGGKVNRRR